MLRLFYRISMPVLDAALRVTMMEKYRDDHIENSVAQILM